MWSESGERTRLRVEGVCMLPLIREGDSVHVVHGTRPPRYGDIVLCREDEELKIQRVVRLESASGCLVLKGDNAREIGSTLPTSKILGVVVAVERRGSVVHFDRRPWRTLNGLIAWHSFQEARLRQEQGIAHRLAFRIAQLVPLRALSPAHLASRIFGPRG